MAIRFFNDQDVFGNATIEGILQVGPVGDGLKVDNSSNDYNVGIGTASPSAKIHVAGKAIIQTSGTATAHSDTDLLIANSTAASSTSQIQILSGVSGSSNLYFSDTAAYSVGGIQYDHTNNKMTLRVAAGSKMTILSSGNVGIGNSTPGEKLTVSGNIRLNNNGNQLRDYNSNNIISNASNVISIGSGATTSVNVPTGNVGIGTTSPGTKLHVSAASSNSQLTLERTGSATGKYNIHTNTNNLYINNVASSTYPLTILNSGNVGIGTTTPSEKLHIADSDDVNIYLESTDTTVTAGQSYGGLIWKSNDGSGIGARDTGRIQLVSSGAVAESDMLFFTTDYNVAMSEKMRITSSGNVGIGTSSPAYKLDVTGDSTSGVIAVRNSANGRDTFRSENAAGTRTFNIGNDSSGHGLVLVRGSNGTTTNYIAGSGNSYFNAGNVGIGTTSPSEKLHIEGDSTPTIKIIDTTNTTITELYSNNFDTYLANESSGRVFIRTGGSNGFVVNSSGNVGIGTTNPAQKLHINGNFLLENNNEIRQKDSGGTQRTIIELDSSNDLNIGGSYAGALKFIGGGSYAEVMRIHDNGNVGIGTINPPYKLTVAGDTYVFNANLHLNGGYGIVNAGNISNKIGFPSLGNFAFENVNVGIGTSSPAAPLSISNSSSETLEFNNSISSQSRILSYNRSNNSYRDLVLDGLDIIFKRQSSETVRIASSGKVGIGTTNPGYKLEISDDTDTTVNLLRLRNADSLYSQTWDFQLDTGKHLVVTGASGSGGIVLKPGSAGLNVTSTSAAQIFLNSATGNDSVLNFRENSSQKGKIGYDTSLSGIALVAGSGAFSSADMVVLDSGNVGIGTTSPGVKLDVTGQIRASSGLEISGGNINLVDNSRIRLGSSVDFQIYHDGSNSYIADTGTGTLNISSNQINLNASNGENGIQINENADVKIRYDNSVKLQTTSTGVSVTGTATATTFSGDLNGTINTATTAVTKANATNDTTVATTAFVQNLIGTIPAGLVFQGTWDAATNTPTLTSGLGTTGHFYIVSTDGSTNLDGITDWKVGDWAVFVEQGATDAWEKVDNSSVLDGSGTGQKVALWSGSGTSNTLTDAPITVSSNNVGIGTSSPTSRLHVFNAGYPQMALQSNTGTWQVGVSTGNDLAFRRGTSGSNYPLWLDSSDNVGIGTTSPANKLTVRTSTSNDGLYLETSQPVTYGKIYNSNSESFPVGNLNLAYGTNSTAIIQALSNRMSLKGGYTTGGQISFLSASTEIMRMTSTGLGIGTTSPGYSIDVNNATSEAIARFYRSDSATSISHLVSTGRPQTRYAYSGYQTWFLGNNLGTFGIGAGYLASTTPIFNITSSGNVGIGTTSPSEKLHVAGTIATNNKLYFTDNTAQIQVGSTWNTGKLQFLNGTTAYLEFDVPNGRVRNNLGKYVTASNSVGKFGTMDNFATTFVVNDSEKVRIDTSGNVGIGTTSPNDATVIKTNTDGKGLTLQRNSTTPGTYSQLGFYQSTNDAGSANVWIRGYRETAFADNYMTFGTNSSEKMRITSSGNVGIGTTSPTEKLHVSGTVKGNDFFGNLFSVGNEGKVVSTSSLGLQLQATAGSKPITFFTNVGGNTERMRISHDGNVGIGTTSPSEKLEVAGAVGNFKTTGHQIFLTRNGNNEIYAVGASSVLALGQNGSEKMRIHSNGNVGIGTTGPGTPLDVAGAGRFSGFVRSNFLNTYDNSKSIIGAPSNYVSIYGGSGAEAIRIDSGGNVGIGTTSPNDRLDIVNTTSSLLGLTYGNNQLRFAVDNRSHIKWTGSSGTFYLSGRGNGLFIGSTSSDASARLHVKGSGSTSSTSSLLVQNSAATELFRVRDDGSVYGIGAGGVDTNAAYGKDALISNTTGAFNTAVGTNSLENNTASFNTGIGAYALNSNTSGTNNVAVGINSLRLNISGSTNTAVGREALYSNTAAGNTAVGYQAAFSSTSAVNLTAIGSNALKDNTTGNSNIAVGYFSLQKNTTGADNVSVGTRALIQNTTGSKNAALGHEALRNNTASNNTAVGYQASFSNTTGSNNTAVGLEALKDNTTGLQNVGLGSYALANNTTAGFNTAVGVSAMFINTTGAGNVALGYQSLYSNTTSNDNTAIGSLALRNNTIGANNTAVGRQSLNLNTTGNFNTALGRTSLYLNTTGSNNTAVGYDSLRNNTASNNVAVGYQAAYNNTTGTHNVAVGFSALDANTTASNNTAIGTYSLTTNTTGTSNTAVGEDSLFYNSTGGSNTAVGAGALRTNSEASGNTAVGYTAAYRNTTGLNNSAFGSSALYTNQTGTRNNAFGVGALRYMNGGIGNAGFGNEAIRSTTTGSHNIGMGDYAGFYNTTGSSNIGIGYRAAFLNTVGGNNVAIGYQSLYSNTASNNTALGYQAGYETGNLTGTSNTFLGYNASYGTATTITNSTAVGANVTLTNSNTVILGNNANVGIGTTSPGYKLHVEGDVRIGQTNKFYINNNNVGIYRDSNNLALGGYGGIEFHVQATTVGSQAERMRIDSAGNVGIGTTNPSNRLQVTGGSIGIDSQYAIRDNRNNTILLQSANTAASNRTLTLGNATYSNIIIPNGNVGIGTTSPSQKLDVVGSAQVSGQTHTGTLRVDATAAGPNPAPNQSPSDAIVRTAGDTTIYLSEPDEWLEININGINYVIPAYLA